ncbi:MAG: peptidyl-prolyl cis-trans isomerase [Elusimicrobia bacterium]|nr:peptidyl-prolyl cis-trans isomerase [Elusimicrobiota bacterium]
MIRLTMTLLMLASTAMAAAVEDDPEIAKVNSVSIRKSEFQDTLLRDYGQMTLDKMVDRILLRQEVAARKIEPDQAAVDKRLAAFRSQFPTEDALQGHLKEAGATLETVRQGIAAELAVLRFIVTEKKLSVSDQEVAEAFEKNKASLGQPKTAHLRHIQVATKKEAEAVVSKLKSGGDFKKLAEEKSLAKSGKVSGGDYGFVPPGTLPPDIDKAVFSMKAGETRIVETKLGRHVLQVLETKPPKPAEFAAVKENLREALLSRKATASLPSILVPLRQKADIKILRQPKTSQP